MSGTESSGSDAFVFGAATDSPAAREMDRLLGRCERDGTAVFFFGSEAQIVYALRDRVGAAFPALKVAGICDADFDGEVSRAIVDFIVETRPGLVLVDMAERDASAFFRAYSRQLSDIRLVNIESAFGAYVLPPGEHAMLRAGGRRLSSALRRSYAAVRFGGIVLAQLMQGGLSRLRMARGGVAMRRD